MKHSIRSVYNLLVGTSLLLSGLFAPQIGLSQSGTIAGSGTVTYNSDGSVTVSGTKTFTSHILSPGEPIDAMVQLDAIGLFRLHADLSGGIKANMNGGGNVRLTVYSYDPGSSTKKGSILYRVKSTSSSPYVYTGAPEQIPFKTTTIASDKIKTLLETADTYFIDRSKFPSGENLNLFRTTISYLNRQAPPLLLSTPFYNGMKGNNYKLLQPVIVEVEVTNATVQPQGLKFPGMVDEFDLANYFDPSRKLEVKLFVNGRLQATYSAGNTNPTPVNLVMGDSVSYEVSFRGAHAPRIYGMPGVWIARFAGDLMYYCTPNVSPGEFNPWIGYDSRVHNMQLRSYAGDPTFRKKVPDWNRRGNTWSWGCTAQRRMSADKTKYQAAYTWIKYKTLKGGSKQRNNQREGLNIQFLDYWQEGLLSDFQTYRGTTKYMMGFDDDELFYINSQHYDASKYPPLPGGGIAKLDSIPSRGMPEGPDQIYDVGTGYPAQGFPLNIIVSAYLKNREWVENSNANYDKTYDGYEIQDIGTDEQHPFGTGKGNVTAPGTVCVRAGNQLVTFKLNVRSPLATDNGMYSAIEGCTWPAYNETNIPYTLNGLQGLSTAELDKYTLVYEGSDALGKLFRQTARLRDLNETEKRQVASTGKWTAHFNNDYPTYSCVTAYYQREPRSLPVIVAGKELKPIFLLFFGEKSLEGKGLGIKIWLNDFRETQSEAYSEPRRFGGKTLYTSRYARTYTFPKNTTTTYQVWDGDPHLFYDSGVEWFLSSRTLAERIPDSYLDGTAPGVKEPYLKFYVDGVEQTSGRKGKEFTYTWKQEGEHTLKVVYRFDGVLTAYQHKIIVIDYTNPTIGRQMGKIENRALTPQEAKWLGIQLPTNYRLFEVKDIYSELEYKAGPRVYIPYINRWAEHNDYASQFTWDHPNVKEVEKFLANYSDTDWFWYNWALHYSSNWRDNLPNGLPPYVPNELVTRVIGSELDIFAPRIKEMFKDVEYAKWQKTIPLVSYTAYQGNRMRTNPSCVYDLNYMWNNTDGAFSGNPLLPPDPAYIQAPDITDEQKDRQEFYYDLKSGRKVILDLPKGTTFLTVHNTATEKDLTGHEDQHFDVFIAWGKYQNL